MSISIIVAMTEDRVIGQNNQLPWHLSEDLKRFKKLTMGHTIVMGRKTFESIGRVLPGRKNIILSRDQNLKIEGGVVAHSLEEAVQLSASEEEIFVIGGANLYEEALPAADKIYLTLIHQDFIGDAYFPEYDLGQEFRELSREEFKAGSDRDFDYTFIVAQRTGN